MRIYHPGTVVALHGHFRRAGRPADPKTVRLIIAEPNTEDRPGRLSRMLVYGKDPELERLDVGHYVAEVRADQAGQWLYTWIYPPRHVAHWLNFEIVEPDE